MASAPPAAPPGEDSRFLAGLQGEVEFPLRVVDAREPVPRRRIVRLEFGRLLVRGLGLVVVLQLGMRETDVVVALETGGIRHDAEVELLDRLEVLARVAQSHALIER
jgi:hypothetical protein